MISSGDAGVRGQRTWRGLSSYLMCTRLRAADAAFSGRGFHIFDSFLGLGRPSREDAVAPMVSGGFILCDDYNWAGAKKAVDEVARAAGIEVHVTETNQAYLHKP
jgi:hypothetical protein